MKNIIAEKLSNGLRFLSESTILFATRSCSFRKSVKRGEYFAGFFGVHFLLFLFLTILFRISGESATLLAESSAYIAFFLMFAVFLMSLSATCRRIVDAGGQWFLPFLPLLLYIAFCSCLAFVFESISAGLIVSFFVLFTVLIAWNAYWIMKPSKV